MGSPFLFVDPRALKGPLRGLRVSDPIRDTFILFGSVVGPIVGPVEYDPILWLEVGSKDPRDTGSKGLGLTCRGLILFRAYWVGLLGRSKEGIFWGLFGAYFTR